MPSPIAHLGVGYAVYRYYQSRLPEDRRRFWKVSLQLIMVAGLSLLPDLDVIPAIVFRDMKAYHNNISHSLIIAIPVALLAAAVFRRMYRSNYWLWFVISLVSYDLHIFMDALTADRGVMMFWPLTNARFASSVKIFYGLQWGLGWFSPWHLWTIFTESLFVLVLLFIVNFFSRREDRARKHVQKEK